MNKQMKKQVAIISSLVTVVIISTIAILMSMGMFAKADKVDNGTKDNNSSAIEQVVDTSNLGDTGDVFLDEECEEYEDDTIDGYKYLEWYEFLELSSRHEDLNTKKEVRQIRIHKINGESRGYTNTKNSFKINKALRTDNYDSLDDEDKLTVETLTNMCNKLKSDRKCLMLRLVALDYMTSVYGIKSKDGKDLTSEMFHKYTEAEKVELADRMQSIVGSTIVEKGFMSASMLPNENIMGARVVEMTIKVPENLNYYITINYNQSEAIFPPGTKLTCESLKYNPEKDKYEMVILLSQD